MCYAGPALVQLYEVLEDAKPRLLYAVMHTLGPTHDMQWQPLASWPPMPRSARSPAQGLGILALALGSGEVLLLGMPSPSSVQQVVPVFVHTWGVK